MDTERVHEPISTALPMKLHMPQPGAYALITARLHYSPENPYAVRMAFHLRPGHEPVVWHMGRDLIRDGLIRFTGEGDVQIGPGPHGSRDVLFRLRAHQGAALLTAPRQPLSAFLRRTAEVVPYGREAATPGFLAGLDIELASILTDPR